MACVAASAAVGMEAGGRVGRGGGGGDVDKWLREPALQRERLPCSPATSQIADFEVTHNCGKKRQAYLEAGIWVLLNTRNLLLKCTERKREKEGN